MSKKYITAFFLVAFLCASLIYVLSTPKGTKAIQPEPVRTEMHIRSDSELHTFWEVEVDETVKSVIDGKSYTELNKHFQEYQEQIFQRTHKSLNIHLSIVYHWASPRVEASGTYDDKTGSAIMEFYVPSLMDGFESNQKLNQPKWKDAFRTHLLIIFMHEMEHIIKMSPSKNAIDLEEESRAWYDTCIYTIAPLIQNYHLPISGDTYILYQAWLASNGHRNEPVWYNAIHNLYGPIDGKSK